MWINGERHRKNVRPESPAPRRLSSEHGRRVDRPCKALGILPVYDIQVNSTSWAESGTSGHSNGDGAAISELFSPGCRRSNTRARGSLRIPQDRSEEHTS